jgi:hypothetical protein
MEGDKQAFEAFYERYRGRIYRFFARQFGTGDFGKAAYYSSWRHLVVCSRSSKTPKELKFNFFQNLGKSSQSSYQNKQTESQSNYLPRDIEEDGKWSLVFIEQFHRLPESMKKRFLFKHEIGLSVTAIARILGDKSKHIEKSIDEAERILRLHMDELGCPENMQLDRLYRESRVVKPPVTWDREILDSYEIWLKQAENPAVLANIHREEEPEIGLVEKFHDWLQHFKQQIAKSKSKAGGKTKKDRLSASRH